MCLQIAQKMTSKAIFFSVRITLGISGFFPIDLFSGPGHQKQRARQSRSSLVGGPAQSLRAVVSATARPATAAREYADVAVKTWWIAWVASAIR